MTTKFQPDPTQVILDKIRLSVASHLSDQFLMDAKIEVIGDWIAERTIVQVKGYIWGKTIKEYEITYPLNWWEAVKERWAPKWFLRRWPAQHRIERLDLKALWPTVRWLVPNHEPRLVLTRNDSAIGGYSEEEKPQWGFNP